MKKTWMRLGLLAALVTAAFLINSCSLTKPVSIADRISSFVNSLNGNRSDTNTNFDPTSAGYLTNSTYWNTIFTGSTTPFSYSPNPPNTSNPSAVDVIVTSANSIPYNFRFVMVNIGTGGTDNWVIEHIQTPPGAAPFI